MADIIKKVNALGLLDQYTIAKSLGQEDEFCKSYGIDIEKGGKAAAIGEIREFGGKKYQKQANGWRPVKKGDQKNEGGDFKSQKQAPAGDTIHHKDGTKTTVHSHDELMAKLDLSKHSKQELLDAMTARAKSGVSESDPEMKQLQAELDKRGEKSTHIGDMSKEQKFAAAAKFGIANSEKLSTKELDKQLTDKNIEAELKKFKESKSKTFEQVLADPEGKQLVEGIEGLDLKREDHKPLYEDYKKQLKQKFGYDYK